MTVINVRAKPRFGDVKLRWEGALSDRNVIIQTIDSHMESWMATDVPSVWMDITGKDLDHLSFFMANGFEMHRVKEGNKIVLNRWLRKTSKTLPPGPFAYIGVAALCIDDANKVLVVRENFKTGPGPWKLPGGLFDGAKDKRISDSAVRECLEETGVRAEFESVVCERFTPRSALFHKQDLYIVCRVKALTHEIKYDPVEIADCQWLGVDEFLAAVPDSARPLLMAAVSNTQGSTEHDAPRGTSLYYP